MSRERIVELKPALRDVELLMVLKGQCGAVQFVILTGWAPPYSGGLTLPPLPSDLSYHSPVALYEGQMAIDECRWLDGEPCYSDALAPTPVFELLLSGGSDAVWQRLEEMYDERFGPEPAP